MVPCVPHIHPRLEQYAIQLGTRGYMSSGSCFKVPIKLGQRFRKNQFLHYSIVDSLNLRNQCWITVWWRLCPITWTQENNNHIQCFRSYWLHHVASVKLQIYVPWPLFLWTYEWCSSLRNFPCPRRYYSCSLN